MPSNLSPRSLEDYRYISSLLSGQYPQHPFRHLLMEFYLSHCQSNDESETRTLHAQKKLTNKEKQCCDLLRAGLSMATVSRETGKSRCYVKSVALKNNIPVNLKPKTITRSIKASVVKLAKKGFHRKKIAKIHGISTGSVELIISTTTGLVEWRKRCKAESLRRRHRCQIVRFIASTPNCCRQEVKNTHEAAFYWLYIHERAWLEKVLPPSTKPRHVDRVDWNVRDLDLVDRIYIFLTSSNTKLSRTELDKRLGGHAWLTSKINKLPKTKKLLILNGFF